MSTCLGRMSTLPPLDSGSSAPITDLLFPEMDSMTFEKSVFAVAIPQPGFLSHTVPRGFNQTGLKDAIGGQTILADVFYYTNFLLVARDVWSKREMTASLTGGFNILGTGTLKAPRYRNQPRIGNMPRGHFARLPNISSTARQRGQYVCTLSILPPAKMTTQHIPRPRPRPHKEVLVGREFPTNLRLTPCSTRALGDSRSPSRPRYATPSPAANGRLGFRKW
jgi:hypothetical protein